MRYAAPDQLERHLALLMALHVVEQRGWTRFVSMQDHLHLIYREEEREMRPLCRAEGIGVIPYSPLASGRLTRDWSSGTTLPAETDQVAKRKYDATAETDRRKLLLVTVTWSLLVALALGLQTLAGRTWQPQRVPTPHKN